MLQANEHTTTQNIWSILGFSPPVKLNKADSMCLQSPLVDNLILGKIGAG